MTNRNSQDQVESYRYRIEDSTAGASSGPDKRRMTTQEIIDKHNQATFRRQTKNAILVFIGLSAFSFLVAAPVAYLILKSGNPGLGFFESLLTSLPIVIAASLLLGLLFAASALMRRPPPTDRRTARSTGAFFRIGIFRR